MPHLQLEACWLLRECCARLVGTPGMTGRSVWAGWERIFVLLVLSMVRMMKVDGDQVGLAEFGAAGGLKRSCATTCGAPRKGVKAPKVFLPLRCSFVSHRLRLK